MSVEQNKRLVARVFDEAFNRGQLGVIDEAVADGAVDHQHPDEPSFREHLKQVVAAMRTAFPDLRFEITEMIGEGEWVACHSVMTGTNTGELRRPLLLPPGAPPSLPPTGRPVRVAHMHMIRFQGRSQHRAFAPDGHHGDGRPARPSARGCAGRPPGDRRRPLLAGRERRQRGRCAPSPASHPDGRAGATPPVEARGDRVRSGSGRGPCPAGARGPGGRLPSSGPTGPEAVVALQRSHGNAFVERALAPARLRRTPEQVTGVSEVEGELEAYANALADLRDFKGEPHEAINHTPSSGGRFDVKYDANANTLFVTVKCAFTFKPGKQTDWDIRDRRNPKEVVTEVRWQPAEEAAFKAAFFAQARRCGAGSTRSGARRIGGRPSRRPPTSASSSTTRRIPSTRTSR